MSKLEQEANKVDISIKWQLIKIRYADQKKPYILYLVKVDAPGAVGTRVNEGVFQSRILANSWSTSLYRALTTMMKTADIRINLNDYGMDEETTAKLTRKQAIEKLLFYL